MRFCIVAGTWLKLVPIIAHGVPEIDHADHEYERIFVISHQIKK